MISCPFQRQEGCVGAIIVAAVSEPNSPSALRTGEEKHTKTKKYNEARGATSLFDADSYLQLHAAWRHRWTVVLSLANFYLLWAV